MKLIPYFINSSSILKIGEECVVLPNSIHEDNVAGLANETAGFILERIDGIKAVEEIALELCAIYDINEVDATDVVKSFVNYLCEKGICKWNEK